MQHINLETFANGAFTAQVNRAIEEVTKNIQDPTLAPIGIQSKTTLAPALGAVTAEIGNQIPGQMSMDDMSHGPEASTVQTIDGKAVDTETGEILGSQDAGNKVVDLRKAREA